MVKTDPVAESKQLARALFCKAFPDLKAQIEKGDVVLVLGDGMRIVSVHFTNTAIFTPDLPLVLRLVKKFFPQKCDKVRITSTLIGIQLSF